MEATIGAISCKTPERQTETEDTGLFELVERAIHEAIEESQGSVHDMCAHIAGAGGKRIRPQLVLQSGAAISQTNARMVNAAVAAELIHMASLVHDDIIDKSSLRRGLPSVNRQWGNHAAVLCGDWLFAKAFALLGGRGMAGSMANMVEAIQAMCQGEMLQAANQYNLDIGIEDYYRQITKKTAKLLECCCKAGALAGNAGAAQARALGEYGLNLGMAFQIIDDILDFQGSSGKMGKPKGEDLRQGIITLPVILLLKDGKYGTQARKLLCDQGYGEESVAVINEMLYASDAIIASWRTAWSFIGKSQESLAALPDSDSRAFLHALAASLRQRDK